MAKGQAKGNMEKRKPKADKKPRAGAAAASPKSGSGYTPFADKNKS